MGRYGGGVLASSFSARRTSTTTTTTTTVSSNKIDVVLEAFSSGFEAEVMLAEEETQYRQRCRFSVGGSGAELHYRVGERRVDSFELASPRINAAMPRILRTFENLSLGLRAVHFHAPRSLDFPILVSLVYASPFDEAAWLDAARTLLPEIHCVGRSKGLTLACDRSSTLEKLFVDDRTFVLEFPEGSFCHPNARANERSLEWLCARLRDIGECDLLELYCGAANHTVTLAALCRTVVAVEVDATLVAAARRNLDRNGVTNATVLASDASKYCARLGAKIKNLFDALLVDPPRRGLDPKTRRILRHYDNVLYVSCNPAALQTDLDFLAETHQIRSFAVLDAFPRTPHLESVSLLVVFSLLISAASPGASSISSVKTPPLHDEEEVGSIEQNTIFVEDRSRNPPARGENASIHSPSHVLLLLLLLVLLLFDDARAGLRASLSAAACVHKCNLEGRGACFFFTSSSSSSSSLSLAALRFIYARPDVNIIVEELAAAAAAPCCEIVPSDD